MSFDSLEQMAVASAEAVRPLERLTVSQAAARDRYLNNPGSFVGFWQNEKTPYMVEPMDTLDSLEHTAVVFAGPARCAKSDIFFNWLLKTVKYDPADMMVVHMTQNTARDWSQGDLAKFFRHTKEAGQRIAPGKQNRNVHDVRFMAGNRLLVKWPTISELSGKTIPRLWLMDYDRMPESVDGEGSPFDLARKRAQTYRRFGMCVAESSPGYEIEGGGSWLPSSRHEAPPSRGILALYNRGDRRRWHWRCPACGEAFEPDFKLLSWPKGASPLEASEQTVMVCPHNGCILTPDMKRDLNLGGRWVRDGQFWLADGSVVGEAVRSDIASFWLKGPAAAFQEWPQLVLRYLQAEAEYDKTGSEEALQTTVNVDQGEPYKPKAAANARLPETLKERAEDWGGSKEEPVVPPGVRFLIATVDVQARAFVVQVHGFGPGGDIWFVDGFKIRKSARRDSDGDLLPVDPAAYPEDWRDLLVEQVIDRTYLLGDGSGRRMRIRLTGCDSGGREGVTANAYAFWRWLRDDKEGRLLQRRFRLVKGEPSRTAPRTPRETWPDSSQKGPNAISRGDVPVFLLNSNKLKDDIAARLGREQDKGSEEDAGRAFTGQIHFPKWAEDWLYTQLTAEIRGPKGEWKNPSGRRNEALDLIYYALGLALTPLVRLEQIDWDRPPDWAAEWEANDFVFDPDAASARLQNQHRSENDLAKLADLLC